MLIPTKSTLQKWLEPHLRGGLSRSRATHVDGSCLRSQCSAWRWAAAATHVFRAPCRPSEPGDMQKLPVRRCRADATACCRSASGPKPEQAVAVDSAASGAAATQLRGPACLQRAAPFQTSRREVHGHAGEATSRHTLGAGRQCGAGRLGCSREDPDGP